ncbi:MAG TPA: molybdopterin-guanine dinucleotide biosynthesis protein B [Longimicrobium sp.]
MPSESQQRPEIPPAVCIVGKKNSGKTTLVVALAARLKHDGYRVATIKHGHHAFESDEPGRDSWRHFNEGEAEASIMCGTGKVALTLRIDGEPDPGELIRDFYAGRGYDVVLVEGFKHGALPKIEVFRRGVHAHPIHDPADPGEHLVAFVTDDINLQSRAATAGCFVIPLERDGGHVPAVARLVESQFIRRDER